MVVMVILAACMTSCCDSIVVQDIKSRLPHFSVLYFCSIFQVSNFILSCCGDELMHPLV